jgi:hypothetical protein
MRWPVPSEVLFGVFEARDNPTRPSLVYCGDKQSGKHVAATLIRDAGFDPGDAGPLRIARYTEPFALLVAQLAYEGEGGPELQLARLGGQTVSTTASGAACPSPKPRPADQGLNPSALRGGGDCLEASVPSGARPGRPGSRAPATRPGFPPSWTQRPVSPGSP